MNKKLTFLAVFTLLFSVSATIAQAKARFTIKFATIAPEGSTWMKVMRQADKEIQQKTNGQVKFRFYPGGVLGDEKDVFRKIRLGQLHCAGFSGVGIGSILPDVRVLDLPFLFRNQKEVDTVLEQTHDYFASEFAKKHFVLLGWTDIGFVNIFSQREVKTLSDLKQTKLWVWQGDPIAEKTFSALNLPIVPLSVMDVMTSLQTGLIDTVYGPSLGIVALQWYTKTRYMWKLPLAHSTGAILMHERFFKKLPDEYKTTVSRVMAKYAAKLSALTVEDNKKALDILQQKGVVFTPEPDPQAKAELFAKGRQIRDDFTGKLYSKETSDKISGILSALRN